MKTKRKLSHIYLITGFVLAQLAWLALLGLWIYWYIANYLIFEKVGTQLSPKFTIDNPSVMIFVLGIVLMVGIEVAMVFTFRNLTVQMKLTDLYDSFIGNISHELKSPLSSIQLYLETLIQKEVTEEKKKEFLNLMMKNTSRLNKLINSILEISRIEQKKIAHDYQIYDADTTIRELIYESAKQFNFPQGSLIFSGKSNCECVIDKDAMQIVFDNLMSNSIKYTHNSVKISIELKSDAKKVIIDFKDNGIGIKRNELKLIFNKFHRIANESSPSVKGTGLGLYLTNEIIKLHDGKISAFSEGENKGAVFRIEIPTYQSVRKKIINSLNKKTENNKQH